MTSPSTCPLTVLGWCTLHRDTMTRIMSRPAGATSKLKSRAWMAPKVLGSQKTATTRTGRTPIRNGHRTVTSSPSSSRDEYREDVAEEYLIDTVYIVRADGASLRLLYSTEEHLRQHQPFTPAQIVESPVWSPDGRRLAFKGHYAHLHASDRGETILHESLYIMEQDGSGLIELLRADRGAGPLRRRAFRMVSRGTGNHLRAGAARSSRAWYRPDRHRVGRAVRGG